LAWVSSTVWPRLSCTSIFTGALPRGMLGALPWPISRAMPLKWTCSPGRYRPRSLWMKPRILVAPPRRSSATPKFHSWIPFDQLPSTTALSLLLGFSTMAISRWLR
jgi:hypothetical protein